MKKINIIKEHKKFLYYANQLKTIKKKTIDSIEMFQQNGIQLEEDALSEFDVDQQELETLDRLLLLPTCVVIAGQEAIEKLSLASWLLQKQIIPSHYKATINNNYKQYQIYYSEEDKLDVISAATENVKESDIIQETVSSEIDVENPTGTQNIQLQTVVSQKYDTVRLGMKHKLLENGLEIFITSSDSNLELYKAYVKEIYPKLFKEFHPIIIYSISKETLTEQGTKELELLKEQNQDLTILFVETHFLSSLYENDLPESEQDHPLWNVGMTGDESSSSEDQGSSSNSSTEPQGYTLSEDLLNTLCDKLGYLQLDAPPELLSERLIDGELKVYSDYVQNSQTFYKINKYFRIHFFNKLIRASTILHEHHSKYMRMFILFAFDMAREIQITPKRIIYAKEKENELYQNLVEMVSQKQDEIKEVISESMTELKENISSIISNHEFKTFESCSSSDLSSRMIRIYSSEIQNLIMSSLNDLVGRHLVTRLNIMRESFLGTLQRCLENLENDCRACGESSDIGDALKQMMNTAYYVEVNTSYSFIRSCLEKMKQIVTAMKPTSPVDNDWKIRVATNLLFSLSETKLTRSICCQFRDRLKTSHDSFVACMKKLENQLVTQLEEKEERQMRLKKMDVPKLARLFLESTSLTDRILNGMPLLEREIGRGQYGVVFGCKSWGRQESCAIKSLVPMDEKHWNDLAMEFYYTKSLPDHNRIVALKGSVIDYSYAQGVTPAVLLIMERLNRDLHSGLRLGLDWKCRLQISLDVTQGIRFLHSQGLVHRDIKLKNVLLNSEFRAKITDLGFCKPEAMMSGSIVGTPIHMAPELFSGHYDNSVDVYAFGILFWYICSGQTKLPALFEQCHSKDHLWNCVRRGIRPERLSVFNEECWALMSSCWATQPSDRPYLGSVEPLLQDMISHAKSTAKDQSEDTYSHESFPNELELSL